MRKLVTLRKVDNLLPIPGADLIELAIVDGWQCVVKKGEFKVGDPAFYFEIDSILPKANPIFDFLTKKECRDHPTDEGGTLEGFRLRTIKLRGQISQGLLLPITVLNDHEKYAGRLVLHDTDENDFSEVFGVKKYEKPISAALNGVQARNFPAWLPKTDQERVQNIFHRIPSGMYYAEEKMEGSSMTIYFSVPDQTIGITSRALDLKLDQEGNTFVDVANESGIIVALYDYSMLDPNFKYLAIRGELIGPGVQGNIYGLKHHRFHIFDVWKDGRYLTTEERFEFLNDFITPYVNRDVVSVARPLFTIDPTQHTLQELVDMANGTSDLAPVAREGLVFKAAALDRHNQVFSFKSISPEYLLKEA